MVPHLRGQFRLSCPWKSHTLHFPAWGETSHDRLSCPPSPHQEQVRVPLALMHVLRAVCNSPPSQGSLTSRTCRFGVLSDERSYEVSELTAACACVASRLGSPCDPPPRRSDSSWHAGRPASKACTAFPLAAPCGVPQDPVHASSADLDMRRRGAAYGRTYNKTPSSAFSLMAGSLGTSCEVPPAGFEPAHTAPEAVALSPELRGRCRVRRRRVEPYQAPRGGCEQVFPGRHRPPVPPHGSEVGKTGTQP